MPGLAADELVPPAPLPVRRAGVAGQAYKPVTVSAAAAKAGSPVAACPRRQASTSLDPHQVKLVEACRRGHTATGDPAFAAAAETVTGLHA